jgi:hypothetical protein
VIVSKVSQAKTGEGKKAKTEIRGTDLVILTRARDNASNCAVVINRRDVNLACRLLEQ